ncbi:MAG: Uma2 family endonuclease, partial [Gammaproteobacteria bacterium]
MPALAYRLSLYEQLEGLPPGLTGEILNGQLYTQPRPSGPHGHAAVSLDRRIGRRYDDGDDGPGGWWILIEPEVHFVRDQEVAVPDLAGWRRERMPHIPEGHRFEVVPDWICEILSPSTASKDREIKLPLYAWYGVAHVWLLDPQRRTLEAYELASAGPGEPTHGDWRLVVEAGGKDCVRVP